MELTELRTNRNLKEDGAILEFEGVKFTVRSLKSKVAAKKLDELREPHKGRIQRQTISDEETTELTHKLFAEAIIVNWEGIEKDGKPFPFNTKNALYLLENYEIIADAIAAFAGNINNFLDSKIEKGVAQLKK